MCGGGGRGVAEKTKNYASACENKIPACHALYSRAKS